MRNTSRRQTRSGQGAKPGGKAQPTLNRSRTPTPAPNFSPLRAEPASSVAPPPSPAAPAEIADAQRLARISEWTERQNKAQRGAGLQGGFCPHCGHYPDHELTNQRRKVADIAKSLVQVFLAQKTDQHLAKDPAVSHGEVIAFAALAMQVKILNQLEKETPNG